MMNGLTLMLTKYLALPLLGHLVFNSTFVKLVVQQRHPSLHGRASQYWRIARRHPLYR
jgi:hypothetical protein